MVGVKSARGGSEEEGVAGVSDDDEDEEVEVEEEEEEEVNEGPAYEALTWHIYAPDNFPFL
jgi:hypothetical protein